MQSVSRLSRCLWFLFMLGILAACAEPEMLQLHDRNAPAGVDFSGMWEIRPDPSGDQQRLRRAIDQTDGIDDYRSGQRRNSSRQRRNSGGGIVHIFLEVGRSLKVTQTQYALFISFDRC